MSLLRRDRAGRVAGRGQPSRRRSLALMVAPVIDSPAVPVVVQIIEQFLAELDRRIEAAISVMGLSWVQVEFAVEIEILRLAEAALNRYLETGLLPSPTQLFRMEQYRLLRDQVNLQIAGYLEHVEGDITTFQRTAILRGLEDAAGLTRAVGREFGTALVFNIFRPNEEAIENLVALARAGQPLQELMAAAYGEAADGMIKQLINGLALGLHPRETARRMRVEGMAKGFAHTEMVARDMQLRSYRMAAQCQYRESGIVQTYTRICAKNSRTCVACLALDGTVYETSEFMPLHPNDRCATIPNVDGLPRVRFQTADEWFRGLDEQAQRRIKIGRAHV